jgi:hypothetical protein
MGYSIQLHHASISNLPFYNNFINDDGLLCQFYWKEPQTVLPLCMTFHHTRFLENQIIRYGIDQIIGLLTLVLYSRERLFHFIGTSGDSSGSCLNISLIWAIGISQINVGSMRSADIILLNLFISKKCWWQSSWTFTAASSVISRWCSFNKSTLYTNFIEGVHSTQPH